MRWRLVFQSQVHRQLSFTSGFFIPPPSFLVQSVSPQKSGVKLYFTRLYKTAQLAHVTQLLQVHFFAHVFHCTLEVFESLLKGYNKNILFIQEVRNLKEAPKVKSNNPRTLNHFQYSSTSTYVNSYAALSKMMERQLCKVIYFIRIQTRACAQETNWTCCSLMV